MGTSCLFFHLSWIEGEAADRVPSIPGPGGARWDGPMVGNGHMGQSLFRAS